MKWFSQMLCHHALWLGELSDLQPTHGKGMAATHVLRSRLVSRNALGPGLLPIPPSSQSTPNALRSASPASHGPGTQVSGVEPVGLLLNSHCKGTASSRPGSVFPVLSDSPSVSLVLGKTWYLPHPGVKERLNLNV